MKGFKVWTFSHRVRSHAYKIGFQDRVTEISWKWNSRDFLESVPGEHGCEIYLPVPGIRHFKISGNFCLAQASGSYSILKYPVIFAWYRLYHGTAAVIFYFETHFLGDGGWRLVTPHQIYIYLPAPGIRLLLRHFIISGNFCLVQGVSFYLWDINWYLLLLRDPLFLGGRGLKISHHSPNLAISDLHLLKVPVYAWWWCCTIF